MREFVLTAPRQLELRDYSEPALNPTDVRVRAIVSGIKHGTEMTIYRGKTPFIEKQFDPDYRMFMPRAEGSFFPLTLGSWMVGEVIEIGSAVTRFKVGDKVHGAMPHRPTNVRPETALYKLAAGMPAETALFTDPAIFALGAVHDAEIKVGDRVAVFGMGAIGLIAIQIARLSGAESVFAVDAINNRLEMATRFGADEVFNPTRCDPALEIKKLTKTKGVDVAIDISGAYAALHTAIRSIQQCGLVVSASYYSGTPQLELGAEWHHNRPTFRSSMPVWGNPHRCHPLWDFERTEATALGLLERGKLTVEPMIGARYPYTQAREAYRMIDEHPEATLKTLLDYTDIQ
ncbi:MAG: zinc-binding dehydrogenase [Anaerolinea sp.]|nr:zinc-binding dehydrogenase [Anaerolinea sp.]